MKTKSKKMQRKGNVKVDKKGRRHRKGPKASVALPRMSRNPSTPHSPGAKRLSATIGHCLLPTVPVWASSLASHFRDLWRSSLTLFKAPPLLPAEG